ncbi:uncharacterized protein LOC117173442 [Belonocnema kinseyi]|uniref:uncharacterized protein LOC117173442 n=1 Tax=Belonocnema kinseyi TaxID=2817044 RepID=UPI00143CE6E6|nr:uncharacterized protein LOC117173442 [Belonocnema kinseyi]
MLRTATFLGRQGLFSRLVNTGKFGLGAVQHSKKLWPLKGMSTGCEEPPICPPEPCLMDFGAEHVGCWQEKYDKDNKEANKDLALGFASLVLSIIVMLKIGFVKGYPWSAFETKD